MPTATADEDLREFLEANMRREYGEMFGIHREEAIQIGTDTWMEDRHGAEHRIDVLRDFAPDARRILDMACGCGNALHQFLMEGYDAHGIDPSDWKAEFNRRKVKAKGYPADWQRFTKAVGEALPYPTDAFDAVTSYQTLEHVQDLDRCVEEALRVTRAGGGVHLLHPDYGTFYEGHYHVPWFPLLPKPVGRVLLRAAGKPTKGLDSLNYVTKGRVKRAVRRALRRNPSWGVTILDVDFERGKRKLRKMGVPEVPGLDRAAFAAWRSGQYVRVMFRNMTSVNLFLRVERK